MAKQPESLLKEKVQRDLKTLKGIWFYKTQEVSRRGIPDLIICLWGRFIAIELKVDSPVTPLQEYTLKKIKEAGGASFVVTPKNWKEVFDGLKAINEGD